MKKSSIFFIAMMIAITVSAQRKTIYLLTELRDFNFQVYIDDELQSYYLRSNYKIVGLSPGTKKLSIMTNTHSHQTPSITIGSTAEKEEYYQVAKVGDKYIIQKIAKGLKTKNAENASFTSYIAKRPIPKFDSTYKQKHTCKIEDSIINKVINQMVMLKDAKSRENLFNTSFNRKCLQANQLRSIGYRLENDKEKYDLYQKYYPTCIDRVEYINLVKTFAGQEYTNLFETWMKNDN